MKIYLMPMQQEVDGPETADIECQVTCDPVKHVCQIHADGYVDKYMYQEYLDWLVHIGWAKIKEEV